MKALERIKSFVDGGPGSGPQGGSKFGGGEKQVLGKSFFSAASAIANADLHLGGGWQNNYKTMTHTKNSVRRFEVVKK